MTVRDSYIGVDPFVVDLIDTLNSYRERIAQLDRKASAGVKKKEVAENWTGADWVGFFESLYQKTYGLPYLMEYRARSYPVRLINDFLTRMSPSASVYHSYIRYIFETDPWGKSGGKPSLNWLWNNKMFKLFLFRQQRGEIVRTVKERPTKPQVSDEEIDRLIEKEQDGSSIG